MSILNKNRGQTTSQEIPLTDSRLKQSGFQSKMAKQQENLKSNINPAKRTHEENIIIATFQELRGSVRDNLQQDQARGGMDSSGIRKQGLDPAKKSIAQGRNSIYASRANVRASKASVAIDRQDPAQRAVYKENVANAEEEYRTMDDHKIELNELYERLQTSENGLSTNVASQRNLELGDNCLPAPKKTPAWLVFVMELLNWFAIMLWIGCGLCILSYFLQTSQGFSNIYLAAVLIIVVVITGTITYMQTSKANDLMDSFKNFLPPSTICYRDGAKKNVDAIKLVPGDIVDIKAGDKIPADVRIIQSREMKVDNSPLTGEPDLLLRKKENTHDNALETANLAFFGTLCREGQGKGIVIRIGGKTVLGQIASFAGTGEKVKTPLRIELDRFVLIITIIAIVLGVAFFFAARYAVNYSWANCITFGIGILVANVPEGLLGCITVSLAITAGRLHKKQVLVKNLEGVETLGSTSCICSDKTGTLTQNKMTVENVWYDNLIRKALNRQKFGKDHDYEYDLNDPSYKQLHECAIVSSDAFFDVPKQNYNQTVWLDAPVNGDASETALVKFFQPIEDIEDTRNRFKFAKNTDGLEAKMPFNSNQKYALSIIEYIKGDSDYCVLMKGAPEKLWTYCSYILENGGARKIDDQWHRRFQQVNLKFGKNGERVLGFAKLHLLREQFPKGFTFEVGSPDKFNFKLVDMTFVGLISLMDPPKDSVPWAVKRCRSAGIKVVMVTGDQPPTAGAIAKMVNIIPADIKTNIDLMEEDETLTFQQGIEQARAIVVHGDRVNEILEHEMLKGVPESEQDIVLREWIKKDFCVFARTTPAQKLKIVRAAQRVGYICAVTGDGVNDSPAIKQGDIGISMGITGAEVTKDAADMILLNDDFASIVDGVEEGRKIFDNLKKTIVYLLTSNVTEIFPFLAQVIFIIPLPLNNMLMLIICVGTDILPAISLAYEGAEIDVMVRRPRTKSEHMVTRKLLTHAYLQMGVISTAGGFFAFFSTMYYYGFDIGEMFKSKIVNLPFAQRCNGTSSCDGTDITYSSYNISALNLGNPYLPTNNVSYANAKVNADNAQKYGIPALDWLFWTTKRELFQDCQTQKGTLDMNYDQIDNLHQGPYVVDYPVNSTNTMKYEVPTCWSVEAVKYGQSSYFVAIVIAQWSNIFSVKSKKMSLIYSQWNNVMLYGILLETIITILLLYVPGLNYVFIGRPLDIYSWCAGTLSSILLFGWVEVRKYLMRLTNPRWKRNWFEWICNW